MKQIDFYFDFISPYAYLAFEHLPEALLGLSYQVVYKPVLFAGLLRRHGQLGPAEIRPKRDWTYRQVLWQAHRHGIDLQLPAAHPFNPLPLLRLAVACNAQGLPNRFATEAIFRHVWRGGEDAGSAQRLRALTSLLAPAREPGSDSVKNQLKALTDEALDLGLFGVPTLVVDGRPFWGFDALPMLRDYLDGDAWFDGAQWQAAASLPSAVARAVRNKEVNVTAPLLIEDGVRACRNPALAPIAEPYGTMRAQVLDDAGFTAAYNEIRQWPGYAPTPLIDLPALARQLGLGALQYKDEGARFGLKSFKALGGAYAVYRLLAQTIARHNGGQPVSAAEVLSGQWRDVVGQVTVTCATDGNHGRSVAWGAQMFGCRCVIYIHATVSEGRRAAIARYGAEVVRVPGNYDDSVRHADAQARVHGWTVVSDTTYEGYRDIPIDVMHGYGVLSREVVAQMGAEPPTHVFVQAGVGAFAASVAAAFWLAWGERRPRLVVVEPIEADCHLRSAQAGRPVAVTGALDTMMAGLACGEVSPAAWEIVSGAASAFVALDDRYALQAVRLLASPGAGDPPVVSGETGAAGLAALLAARQYTGLRALLELDDTSRVLLLGSEGDTDPDIYRSITGKSADEVRA